MFVIQFAMHGINSTKSSVKVLNSVCNCSQNKHVLTNHLNSSTTASEEITTGDNIHLTALLLTFQSQNLHYILNDGIVKQNHPLLRRYCVPLNPHRSRSLETLNAVIMQQLLCHVCTASNISSIPQALAIYGNLRNGLQTSNNFSLSHTTSMDFTFALLSNILVVFLFSLVPFTLHLLHSLPHYQQHRITRRSP
jgi:hypothetical protein